MGENQGEPGALWGNTWFPSLKMNFIPHISGQKARKEKLDCLSKLSPAIINDLNKIFREEHRCEKAMTEVRQRQTARRMQGDRRSIDGIGRLRMEVDNYSINYWGQKLGFDCWSDPTFLREFERDNPHARVRSGGTRPQVGWRAPDNRKQLALVTRGPRRYTKHYAN